MRVGHTVHSNKVGSLGTSLLVGGNGNGEISLVNCDLIGDGFESLCSLDFDDRQLLDGRWISKS